MLEAIADRRVREKLARTIDSLESDPELRGKPLGDDLAGYRSVRAVGQRYRIIYRVERSTVVVMVVAAGITEGREPRGYLPGGGQADPSRTVVMCVMASPVLACNIQAISAAERPRYNDLVSRLRAAIRTLTNCRTVTRYSLDSAEITLPELSEWLALERLCCPFLIFTLEGAGQASA